MPGEAAIEFFGLPGAGKTTLAVGLAKALTERGFPCRPLLTDAGPPRRTACERIARQIKLLGICARFPRLSSAALAYALRIRPYRAERLSRVAFLLRLVARAAARDTTSHDVIVADQGVLQAIWSIGLFGSPPSARPLETLLRSVHKRYAPLVVVVEVTPATAHARLVARPRQHSRLEELDSDEALARMSASAHALETIVDAWLGPAIRVDNERAGVRPDELGDLAARVQAAFRSCY